MLKQPKMYKNNPNSNGNPEIQNSETFSRCVPDSNYVKISQSVSK